ncbi:MAG: M23 family metallopeptidase [Saprospiraceae bacterium]
MKRYTLTLFLLCLVASLSAQEASPELGTALYPKGTYRSPVNHPIKISGTFGELRSDHFHMGIDVKSARGVGGDNLYAVADGYINRIRISATGYGNALYIDHPNGTRSLYGHMDSFTPDIQRWVDSVHYAQESFEINVEALSPDLFPIKRGQKLGTMGNTGSSFGAHLHYELRLQENDAAFNPLLFDFPVKDTRAPEMRGLTVFMKEGNGAARAINRFAKLIEQGNDYTLSNEVHVPPGEIGFGLKTYDRQEGTRNSNGVYQIESRANGQLHWQATYDTIAFEETRYIQAHYDFEGKANKKGYFYRMHRLPGDELPIYDVKPRDGWLNLGFGESRKMVMSSRDPFGNSATLSFTVIADLPEEAPAQPSYNYLLPQNEGSILNIGSAELLLSDKSLYHDTYLTANVSDVTVAGAYSRCYTIGNPNEPIHVSAKLQISLHDVPMGLRPNTYLSNCDDAEEDIITGKLTTGSTHLEVNLSSWGSFCLRVDQRKPTIKVLDRYTYVLADDISSERDLRYRVSQGDTWVLANYDAKKGRLTVRKDKVKAGKITVEAWDKAGNRAVY